MVCWSFMISIPASIEKTIYYLAQVFIYCILLLFFTQKIKRKTNIKKDLNFFESKIEPKLSNVRRAVHKHPDTSAYSYQDYVGIN